MKGLMPRIDEETEAEAEADTESETESKTGLSILPTSALAQVKKRMNIHHMNIPHTPPNPPLHDLGNTALSRMVALCIIFTTPFSCIMSLPPPRHIQPSSPPGYQFVLFLSVLSFLFGLCGVKKAFFDLFGAIAMALELAHGCHDAFFPLPLMSQCDVSFLVKLSVVFPVS
jgi:hypothetical protein